MEDVKKTEKDEISHGWKTLIIQLFLGMLTLSGAIYTGWVNMKIQKSQEEHERYLQASENAYEQEFYMSEELVIRASIEHKKYEISTKPPINGFHIIPYVYVVIETEEKKEYVPVEGQFLQKEYVASQDGTCILFRENTTKDLLDSLKEQGCEARMECIMAIEYAVDGKLEVSIYELRTGQLVVAEEEEVMTVLEAWKNIDYVKIDMMSWPVESEEQLKELLAIIGY